MKKLISTKYLLSSLGISFLILLLSCNPAKATGMPITFQNPANQYNSLLDFIIALLGHLQATVAILAIVAIVLAGIMYIISGASGNDKLATVAKYAFVSGMIGFTLVVVAPSLLRQINMVIFRSPLAPIGINIHVVPTLQEILANTLTFLLSIIGILAIISLTISGVMYLLAGAIPAQAEKAKKAMIASIVGVTIAGASLIIIQQLAIFFS